MNLSAAVGKRTQELLFEKKITQYKLTKLTGFSPNTIGGIINGRYKDTNLSTIFIISDALNMTVQEFINSPIFDKNNLEY